jgi:Putative MetA-pathway of phenol degradation
LKPLILILMMLSPIAVIAQETQPDHPNEPTGASTSVREDAISSSQTAFSERRLNTGPELHPFGQQSNAPPPPKTKKPPKPRAEIERPRIEGSMVGYIDNAIVGSQIRIRFDAAFNDEFPDRSEFFYAKCGCFRGLPSQNAAFDPNAPGPGPGIPKNINFQQLYFDSEYALSSRFSVFTEIPIRWLQPQGERLGVTPSQPQGSPLPAFPNGSGIGDVMAGLKFAALASPNRYLTFQFRAYFPSGDALEGLGTNHYSIEPGVLYYQRLSGRLAFEAQVRDWHPIGGSAGVPVTSSKGFAGDVFMYGVGPSYLLYNGERFRLTPVVELFGWRVLGGFQTQLGVATSPGVEVDGTNIVNLKLGARIGLGRHSSLYFGYGKALTDQDWYDQIVRAEYRYSF